MHYFSLISVVAFSGLLTGGCVRRAPEAMLVKITTAPADVAGCQILGTVRAQPPYVTPKDGLHQMQNEVAGRGGDTLFVTTYHMTATGMAYRCGCPPTAAQCPPTGRPHQ